MVTSGAFLSETAHMVIIGDHEGLAVVPTEYKCSLCNFCLYSYIISFSGLGYFDVTLSTRV